jgi:hypothetical protein
MLHTFKPADLTKLYDLLTLLAWNKCFVYNIKLSLEWVMWFLQILPDLLNIGFLVHIVLIDKCSYMLTMK